MSKSDFRKFVPPFGTAKQFGLTPEGFFNAVAHLPTRVPMRKAKVAEILSQPFKGITTNGSVTPGLFQLQDEGAPTAQAADAAAAFLNRLSPEQLKVVLLPLDSREKNTWQNTIVRYETLGLRLDLVPEELRAAAMEVLRASMSAAGYDRTRNVMKLNRFLGELVGAPLLLNEWSYQFLVYGRPSTTEPWGWQLTGHHLVVTCFMVGGQMVMTPTFFGAEPRYIDAGPDEGLCEFEDEEREGLALMQSFSAAQRRQAIFTDTLLPELLPPGRHQGIEGLTLGGAYTDNRIIPYEGIPGADLTAKQRQALLDLTQKYLTSLPAGPFAARMEDIERHIAETHFCWAGGIEEDSTFYYRIQSPVVLIEFDHHKGVVLNNPTPEKFHVHTVIRTPNGNDYGADLLRLHYETSPHHRHHHDHHHEHGHDHHDHDHDHHNDHDNRHDHAHPHDHHPNKR